MKTDLFDFDLPAELIAQEPIEPRDSSRLMVIDKTTGGIEHKRFSDLPEYLRYTDHLVINDTRVIRARLLGVKEKSGANIECFILQELPDGSWEALVRPARKVKAKDILIFHAPDGAEPVLVEVVAEHDRGKRIVRFIDTLDALAAIEKVGHVPLPPYIKKHDIDSDRYQTIYARQGRSTAAPTAGLHFTDSLLTSLKTKGISFSTVQLDIGLDTFRPIGTVQIEEHAIHSEHLIIDESASSAINCSIDSGDRIIAVGTTAVRAIESAALAHNDHWHVASIDGSTSLYITPGYDFRITTGMVTNFHLPRSSLIVMVCAFVGYDLLMRAYKEAIAHEYRFLSFGDAMLIL